MGRYFSLACWIAALGTLSCRPARPAPSEPDAAPPLAARAAEPELSETQACTQRIAQLRALPSLPGAPEFDRQRHHVLGRARGEPMVFVREPARTAPDALPEKARGSLTLLEQGPPGVRIVQVARRHGAEPRTLRALMLREGYVYAPDPHDALALVNHLRVAHLFDEPELWLMRRAEVVRLQRARASGARCALATCPASMIEYRYADGAQQGRAVELLFGDRFGISEAELAEPLHRDLRALSSRLGLSRVRLLHTTERAMVAELRYGSLWVPSVLQTTGASVSLSCTAADGPALEQLVAWKAANAARIEALARIEVAIDEQVHETLRFDRPEGVKHAELDGKLRPIWSEAYRRKQTHFSYDDASYPVFDARGRAWPPQVCVDLVLDTYERASGTWFAARSEVPKRTVGGLDFDAHGIQNRRGVLAFEQYASSKPALFTSRRFAGEQRIPFGQRARFFDFLLEHADEFHPADVVAIQGRKQDGLIHQHAIFVESTDPLTGFPYGLADQMKRPRRRTWEGIMAEAPLRSLLYQVTPTPVVFESIAGQRERSGPATASIVAGGP